jgi:NADH-quinone oxidoreductase subunit G
MEEVKPQLIKITFDGIEVEVEPGTTIMQAARKIAEADESQAAPRSACNVLL